MNRTPTQTACTHAHSASQHILNRLTTFHHANPRGSNWKAQDCTSLCTKQLSSACHVSIFAAPDTDRKHKFSLTYTSPIFPTTSPTHTRSSVHDTYLPCEVRRQSGGSAQIPSLTGYEPKAIGTEAIEPEDLEPRRIELDRNLGTDPCQIQERLMRNNYQNPIAEVMDEFGKFGADMSYIQSQMHSDYDSAESIAESDLEDGELRKMLASPLYRQGRGYCKSSRIPTAPGKLAAMIQERGASAKRTEADRRESLMSSSSQEPRTYGKPDAMFSLESKEPGNLIMSLFFKDADPSNMGRCLLEGNKDHLLS